MQRGMHTVAWLMTSLGLLSGCAAQAPHSKAHSTEALEQQLLSTAQAVESSLRTLAEAQQQPVTPLIDTAPLLTPQGGMGTATTLDWSGPIEPLLQRIAQMTHYRVKVLGPAPAVPVLISITAEREPIAHVLKNAGLQAGKRAHIVVYPATKVIELRYSAS